jgi:CheY-like chemotaxis protein
VARRLGAAPRTAADVNRFISRTRILVATDQQDDADLIVEQLQGEFTNLRVSIDLLHAMRDFEEYRPEVVVLAFDELAKAQRYCRSLEEGGLSRHRVEHRMVMLCNRTECEAVVELCRQELFDDYVMYWPQAYDGFRLAMSIRIAGREMVAFRTLRGQSAEPRDHALAADEADRTLEGERVGGARTLAEEVRKLRPVVLVVDDDEFAREIVGRILDPQRWEAVFAHDGAAALDLLGLKRPDVILMDIRLPGIDGMSLTKRLKSSAHLADIPVIMMTGDARKETLLSSVAAGAAGFVVKPFTRSVLTAKLEKLFPQ